MISKKTNLMKTFGMAALAILISGFTVACDKGGKDGGTDDHEKGNPLEMTSSVTGKITINTDTPTGLAVKFTWNTGETDDSNIEYWFDMDIAGNNFASASAEEKITTFEKKYLHRELYDLITDKWSKDPWADTELEARIRTKQNGTVQEFDVVTITVGAEPMELTASASSVTLAEDTPNANAVTFTWNSGTDAVTYVFDIDIAENDFASAITSEEITSFTKSFIQKDLYDLIIDTWGKEPGATVEVQARIRTYDNSDKLLETATATVEVVTYVPTPSREYYLAGTAINDGTAANAIKMTANEDTSYTWTGTLSAGDLRIIFDQTSLTPALAMGEYYNILEETSATDADLFEIESAGKYSVTIYPAKKRISIRNIFENYMADAGNVKPMNEEFDVDVLTGDWAGALKCNSWAGNVDFSIDENYKLSGKNSLLITVNETTDGNIQIRRDDSDGFQMMAIEGNTYTVTFQLLYEGADETKTIPLNLGGGLDYTFNPELKSGVPAKFTQKVTGTTMWGGNTNFTIQLGNTGDSYKLWLDAVSIGFDD